MHFDIDDFIIKINNNHWGTNHEHINVIYGLIANNTLQVKFKALDKNQKSYITDRVIKANGSIKKTMPVIIMEGRAKDGGDLIINGKHTTEAVHSVWLGGKLDGNDIKTIRIPYSDNKDLSITQIKLIAIGLNVEPEVRLTGFKRLDAIKFVVDTHFETNLPVTDKVFKEYLTSWKFSSPQICRILKSAQDDIEKKNIEDLTNTNWIDYSTAEKKAYVKHPENKDKIAFYCSSAMFKWDTIINLLFDDGKLSYFDDGGVADRVMNKKDVKVYIHHTAPAHEENWRLIYKEEIECKFQYIYGKLGYTLELVELPHLESNDVLV